MEIACELSIEGLCNKHVMLVYQNYVIYEDGTKEEIGNKRRMCYFNNADDLERLRSDLVNSPSHLALIEEIWGGGKL